MAVPDLLRQAVIMRAGNRCEYCRLSQSAQEATFHIDHIIPESAQGLTTMDNLALACVTCSLRKAARVKVLDSVTHQEVPLFNPRKDLWLEHFSIVDLFVIGSTATGRATVDTLLMNRPRIISIRNEERERGRFP